MSQQLPRDPSGNLLRGRAGPGPGLQRIGSSEPPAGEKLGKIPEFQGWEWLGEGLRKIGGVWGWNLWVLGSFSGEIPIFSCPKDTPRAFRGFQRNFSKEIPIPSNPEGVFPGKSPSQRNFSEEKLHFFSGFGIPPSFLGVSELFQGCSKSRESPMGGGIWLFKDSRNAESRIFPRKRCGR